MQAVLLSPVRQVWLTRLRSSVAALVVALLLPDIPASANPSAGSPGGLFDIWPVNGDWQPSAVTTIVQSHEGYLWLGTYHGLNRFDGVHFMVFDAGNTPGLTNGLITSLYEDSRDTLWIGHETGHLSRFTDGQFKPVPLNPKWPGGSIEFITADESGDLWLLNDTGWLFRVRDAAARQVPGGASASRKAVLSRDSKGRLWIVSNGEISTVDRGKIIPFSLGPSSQVGFVERVLPAQDGGLWVLANQRLRKWVQGRWAAELDIGARLPGSVSTLLETRTGAVLAGTLRDGLFLFRAGMPPLQFTRKDGLSHPWVRALSEDREGNLWIGTSAGFDGLRQRKVQMLSPPDDWGGCSVLSFSLPADGSAWIGTEGAGLYRYRQQQWSSCTESSGVSNLYVWSVLLTRRGDLYLGTYGGGLLVQHGQRFDPAGELAKITAPVVSLYEGHQGELWIGTTAGLYRSDGGRITWFAGKDKLAFPDVRAITQTVDDTLWFGMSGGGLGYWKHGTLRQFRKTDGLGSDQVVCLYAEPDGTLWIGTSDHGLTRFRNGKFAAITVAQGLPSSIITHLVDDGAGNLWMGSHNGILRASLQDLNRCADGNVTAVRFLSYGRAEGLTTQSCSGGFQPGAGKSPDGHLWFPTSKGIALVDPTEVTTNAIAPPVVIEQFLVDSQSIALPPGQRFTGPDKPAALEIPPGNHRFEVRYTGLSFVAPEKVQFKYKLEGLEHDWREVGPGRSAEYSYLRPGEYQFRVIAANNDGVWNDTGATLAFTVLPFFWQTWWFQALTLSGGAGLVGGGALWASRRRLRLKLEQLERQRGLERERARIARDIHDDLGASLTRITMLSQSVRSEVEGHPEAAEEVDNIYQTARELTRAMDEIVWAVNPKHDTLDSLVTYLGRFAQQFLSAASVRCRLDVPVNLPAWPLTAEVRHNVFLAFKEALHNVLKHAKATEVRVSLELVPNGFVLIISDNGRGFDAGLMKVAPLNPGDGVRVMAGNGLQNMKRRLEEAGGRCEWDTAPGEGTRVRLEVEIKTRSRLT